MGEGGLIGPMKSSLHINWMKREPCRLTSTIGTNHTLKPNYEDVLQ